MPGTEIYWNPAIYEREMERIFGSVWLFVGHDAMIIEAGRLRYELYGEVQGGLRSRR